ncbi:MAG: phytanoyl-CoA dioxygenase family protein [Myxococcota bacterium]|nr:phytanoyl-CoA dioxygenase family protein [Myxococcota bacterium]
MAIEGFEDLDFHAFHERELPRRLSAGHGALAAPAAAPLESLAFRLADGSSYTYRAVPGGIAVAAGDDAADTVLEIDAEDWQGLVHDYESAPGLLYGGRVRCLRGKAMSFVLWEPALRAMFTGRPVFDPEAKLGARDGGALDPARTFTLDDDREEMAHFLRTAGFLCVRRVFAPEEVKAFLEDAHALRREAVKGDKLSWWAKTTTGEEICCRVTRAADGPHLVTLRGDPRIRRLADLADEPLVPRKGEGNGVTVIYKIPGIEEGLANLPWHRDCGMGGHSVMCPVLIASVFLTPATPETGELRFLPGSWQGTTGFREATDPAAPRGVGFRAEPGDVTVHYGDVMHAAPPPTREGLDVYRISATTGFARAQARVHRGGSYNEVLHQREDGQIEHLSKVAERA